MGKIRMQVMSDKALIRRKTFFWREIDIQYLGTKHKSHLGKISPQLDSLTKTLIYKFYFKLHMAGRGKRVFSPQLGPQRVA